MNNDVKKIKKLYEKWQPSLDLLVDYFNSSGGVFIRTFSHRVEPSLFSFPEQVNLSPGSSYEEIISQMNLFPEEEPGLFSKGLDEIDFQSDLLDCLKGDGFIHAHGFSVEYGGDFFGIVFLLNREPQPLEERNYIYLSHFKRIFEDDLNNFFQSCLNSNRQEESVERLEKGQFNKAHREESLLADQNWLASLTMNILEGAYQDIRDNLFSYLLTRTGADRVYSLDIDWSQKTMGVNRELTKEGALSCKEERQSLPLSGLDHLINSLNRNHFYSLCSVEELPSEATFFGKILKNYGVSELHMSPLFVNGQLEGILALDFSLGEMQWGAQERSLLRSASYLLSLAQEKEITLDHLDKSERQLEEMQISRSNLLSTLNHEIQTPINSIVEHSEFMAREVGGAQSDYSDLIKANRDDLYETISRITEYTLTETRGVEIHGENIPVLSFLDDFHTSHRQEMPENVELITRVHSPVDFSLYTDEQRVNQILNNFISNAVHFTKEGEIKIECRLKRDDHLIIFSVSDTGVGIPVEKQDVIFNRFIKLDPLAKGTGLGLTICQTLATALGGEISVTSEVGKGSVFSLLLPIDHCRESA